MTNLADPQACCWSPRFVNISENVTLKQKLKCFIETHLKIKKKRMKNEINKFI